MGKAIIILSGDNDGKTAFDKICKANKYWVWNVNPWGNVEEAAKILGSPLEKNEKYYKDMADLMKFANDRWSFSQRRITEMVQKFQNNPQPDLLVLHGLTKSMAAEVIGKNENAFTVHIVVTGEQINNYNKVILIDSNFENNVVSTLNILTKEIEKESE